MIELQRLTGMRPGEVVIMRTRDLEKLGTSGSTPRAAQDGAPWQEARGTARAPGPAILQPWLKADADAYLFSPADATAERQAEMRLRRKTRVQPSQRDRGKFRPKKIPGVRYTVASYRKAIQSACQRGRRSRTGIPINCGTQRRPRSESGSASRPHASS